MIIDPDYARVFTKIRCTAWSYGYAVGLHGSFTRDLDLILVPWADHATKPQHLIDIICLRADLHQEPDCPRTKPHGRLAWSLRFKECEDPRWIDISITPMIKKVENETN